MKGVIYRRRGRRKQPRSVKPRRTPTVFAVHKVETYDGRFHEVSWARDGNLNAAHRRGNIKRFRLWGLAKRFAKGKGKELGVIPTIS